MDAFLLFSPESALNYINDISMLPMLLNLFLFGEAQEDINKMTFAYEKKDWGSVEKLAHKLKGGTGYIGLLRLSYACQYLERYYKAGHRDLLEKLYYQLIDVNQESIKEVKSWMNKFGFKESD